MTETIEQIPDDEREAERPEEPLEDCTGGFIGIDGVDLRAAPVFEDPFTDQ